MSADDPQHWRVSRMQGASRDSLLESVFTHGGLLHMRNGGNGVSAMWCSCFTRMHLIPAPSVAPLPIRTNKLTGLPCIGRLCHSVEVVKRYNVVDSVFLALIQDFTAAI